MNEKLTSFSLFIRNNWIVNGIVFIIITFLFQGVLTNVLVAWLMSNFGISSTTLTSLTIAFFLLGFVVIWFQSDEIKREKIKNRAKLKANPTSEDLQIKYKAAIFLISRISEPKQNILNKINAVRDINDNERLRKVYEIRGIGQTFRAITHHIGELRYCWLLCSEDVKESKELIEYFIKKFSENTVLIYLVKIDDPFKVEETFKEINKIYGDKIKDCMLTENDVIADLTGGTSIMSCAMILSCLSPDRKMEYMLQNEERTLIEIKENVSDIIFKR